MGSVAFYWNSPIIFNPISPSDGATFQQSCWSFKDPTDSSVVSEDLLDIHGVSTSLGLW